MATEYSPGRPVYATTIDQWHDQADVIVVGVGGAAVRPDGSVIAGLYAAGRCSAGLPRSGEGYASGMSIGDATYFGRRAGRAVAKRN